jgi:hypothetical protein
MEIIYIYSIHLIILLWSIGVAGLLFESKIANSEGYQRFRLRALHRAQ